MSLSSLGQTNEIQTFKSANKASILSAIIPGSGQIYNKKYWKVPIIYASLATSIYFIKENQNKLNNYQNAYIQRSNGVTDEYFNIYNNSQLITIIDYYQRFFIYHYFCYLSFKYYRCKCRCTFI